MYSDVGVFTANTQLAGSQENPGLAQLANGNVAVAWTSRTSTSSGIVYTIRAQIVTPDGDKVGVEFQVNSTATQGGEDPVVLALPSGNFVVAWSAYPQGGDGAEVKAQIFTSAGVPVGSEIAVNSTTFGHQQMRDMAALDGGGFVIVYENSHWQAQQDTVIARVFDSAGTPQGADFVVPTTPDSSSLYESVDFRDANVVGLAGGGFLVSWLEYHTIEEPPYGVSTEGYVKARLYGADGLPAGAEFLIGDGSAERRDEASLVALSSGNFVAIWSEGGTRARMIDSAGNPVGAEILLLSEDTLPRVTALAQGGFLVSVFEGPGYLLQAFDDAMAPVGEPLLAGWPGDPYEAVLLGLADTRVFAAFSANADAQANDDVFVHRLRLPITQAGGPGNDTYIVGNPGDVVIEDPNEGVDIIYSSVSYSLNDSSEVESLSTITWELTDPINLTGNGLDNHLIGNAGRNRLDGGGGNDVMTGREGNDTYVVDSAGDRVLESAGGGTDIIYSAVSYSLNDSSEVESLSTMPWEATTAINLAGNGLANHLIGNAGANQLNGRGGADTMIGREGNDTYLVDNAGDKAFEAAGGGTDAVYSAVSFTLTDGQEIEGLSTITWELTNAIDLTGNKLNNYLIGNAGANVLDGRAGNDTLHGREGADTYAFTTVLGPQNVDVILGFSAADDIIALENNGVFVGLSEGALPASAFVIGTAALDANDRIVYNQATGQLFFDADGDGAGAQIQFARLDGAPIIAAGDFTVI